MFFQVHLVNKLRALLHEFDECQKRAHNEELRRQRLAYVNVSLSNVIPDGRRKRKKDDDDDDDESGSESETDVSTLIVVQCYSTCISILGL